MLLVAGLIWSHGILLWQIFVLSLCFGLADAFSFPATQALIPSLVAAEQLPAANSAIMTSAQVSAMVAPVCAGIAIKTWGVASVFFFDAVSFLFLLVPLVRLPEKHVSVPAAKKGILDAILEGLHYVASDPPLRALMILGAGLNLAFSGTITVGLAALAKSRLGSVAAYGTLLSALSLGGLLGGFLPESSNTRGAAEQAFSWPVSSWASEWSCSDFWTSCPSQSCWRSWDSWEGTLKSIWQRGFRGT